MRDNVVLLYMFAPTVGLLEWCRKDGSEQENIGE
jgi:hypothetical protein